MKFYITMRNGGSRSSKIVDFATNRKRVCNLLLVISSNLAPNFPRFRGIAGFLLKTATFAYPTPIPREISGCSP